MIILKCYLKVCEVLKRKYGAFLLPEQCCFKYGLCQNEYSKRFHALPFQVWHNISHDSHCQNLYLLLNSGSVDYKAVITGSSEMFHADSCKNGFFQQEYSSTDFNLTGYINELS